MAVTIVRTENDSAERKERHLDLGNFFFLHLTQYGIA